MRYNFVSFTELHFGSKCSEIIILHFISPTPYCSKTSETFQTAWSNEVPFGTVTWLSHIWYRLQKNGSEYASNKSKQYCNSNLRVTIGFVQLFGLVRWYLVLSFSSFSGFWFRLAPWNLSADWLTLFSSSAVFCDPRGNRLSYIPHSHVPKYCQRWVPGSLPDEDESNGGQKTWSHGCVSNGAVADIDNHSQNPYIKF